MRVRTTLLVLLLFCAVSTFAQTVTIGNVFEDAITTMAAEGVTAIDLAHPATATGTIEKIGFAIGTLEDTCPDYAMIKFFRREGDMLTLIAAAGPISWVSDTQMTTLATPIEIRKGDLIGITAVTSCGHLISFIDSMAAYRYLSYPTNVMGNVSVAAGTEHFGKLAVWAEGTSDNTATEHTARILPVVGSLAGDHGSHWRTSVQLHNPYAAPSLGQLVLHQAGDPAASHDRTMRYYLAPGETQTYDDIVAAMGSSGLGSLDVVTYYESEEAGMPPVVTAHIFNDAGAGTVGLVTEAFDPQDRTYECATSNDTMIGTRVLRDHVTGFLIAPESAERTRFNIGVRSLASGATLTATVSTPSGQTLTTVTRSYPANYFIQQPAATFLELPLTGGESIRITITEGAAIVYGTSTDNVTNDSAIQYVYSRFFAETQ